MPAASASQARDSRCSPREQTRNVRGANSGNLLITCEHAGNDVPAEYAPLFRGHARVLNSHRGFDPGSLELGKTIARRCHAPLIYSTVTRLLVELNRSLSHPQLFSEFTRPLDRATKEIILEEYYHPHRTRVQQLIAEQVAKGNMVVHVSMHTFTPVWDGQRRNADVGLLYDPRRGAEKKLCAQWRQALRQFSPELRIRNNYPYRGNADGLTTFFRRQFNEQGYLGIELEINQEWPRTGGANWRNLQRAVAESLESLFRSTTRNS